MMQTKHLTAIVGLTLAVAVHAPGQETTFKAAAAAPEIPANLGITADRAIVMLVDSGEVLGEKNPDSPQRMASTTKIMTALIAIERTQLPPSDNRFRDLDEIVTVSRTAADTGGSTMGLEAGEQLTLRNLLYGMMLRSANDAAVAIAEHIDGDEESFVASMNVRAGELSLTNTHYENAHGRMHPARNRVPAT
jgi:D-alanyl-D-alanine carboxypeptidase